MINLKKITIKQFAEKVFLNEINLKEFYLDWMSFVKERDRELMAFEVISEDIIVKRIDYLNKFRKEFEKKGQCYGTPFSVKDVINTRELTTEKGSSFWKGYTAGNNARVVDAIENGGGVMTGKTVTAELAVDHPGATRNPHNYEYSPGTSSMGSAVAVASGMSLVSLGTQTGSSIIRPASYTGVFGYKPTYGTVPRIGVLKTTDTLDHIGFFANHIEDIKLMFDMCRVHGPNYPICHKYLKERAHFENKISVGIFRPQYLWKNYQDYVKSKFESLINVLRKHKNLTLFDIEDTGFFNKSHEVHSILYDKSLHYYFRRERSQKDVISNTLAKRIEHGETVSIDQFHQALKEQEGMREAFDRDFIKFDVILTPSTANIAPKRNNYREVDDTGLIWTLLGAPSLNVPVFRGPDQMPFGLQVSGVRYSDYKLLEIVKSLIDDESLIIDADINIHRKQKEEGLLSHGQ